MDKSAVSPPLNVRLSSITGEGSIVPDRRPMGALEHDVLVELWSMPEGGTPAEVLDALGHDLAYTTVMTILSRLWQKGLVTRQRHGRAYLYRPALTEAELTAHRMYESLTQASDQKEALSLFVDTLSAREVKTLRSLIASQKRTR